MTGKRIWGRGTVQTPHDLSKITTVPVYARWRMQRDVATARWCQKLALQKKWKRAIGEEQTQTLRAGCSKAMTKFFVMLQTPFPGVRDSQNLISWRWSLPLHTNPVWWGSTHAISSYRGNRPTHKHTHRQDRLQYTVLQLACSVIKNDDDITFVHINSGYYYLISDSTAIQLLIKRHKITVMSHINSCRPTGHAASPTYFYYALAPRVGGIEWWCTSDVGRIHRA